MAKNSFDFHEALNQMCAYQKVTRQEWGKNEYGLMMNDRLTIHLEGKFHDWILSYADLLAEDWVVV